MVQKELLQIIKCVLTQKNANHVHIECWERLISLAKTQNVLTVVAYFVESLSEEKQPDANILKYLKNYLFQMTVFSANQLHAVESMQKALEEEEIYSVKLKGSCTKLRYANDVLRTMGDIDILYKPEQHKAFRSVLEEKLQYGNFQEGRKNDTYDKEPNLHIEAHRELVGSDSFFAEYYSHVWERCVPVKGCTYTYEMSLEDEYIFNFIHLTEHFKNGGIGVRFIMDIYVYEHLSIDFNYVQKVLDSFGLLDFYRTIVNLSECWFGEKTASPLENKLAAYIFSGGVFGNLENASALSMAKGGKFKFILRTCFPNYKDMCSMFTWLKGKKILLPLAWVIRAFRSLFRRRENIKEELTVFQIGDADRGKQIREFYGECGFPKDIYN